LHERDAFSTVGCWVTHGVKTLLNNDQILRIGKTANASP